MADDNAIREDQGLVSAAVGGGALHRANCGIRRVHTSTGLTTASGCVELLAMAGSNATR